MSRHPGKLVARRTEVRGFISSPALARPTHSPVRARRTGLVAPKHRTQHLLGQLALNEVLQVLPKQLSFLQTHSCEKHSEAQTDLKFLLLQKLFFLLLELVDCLALGFFFSPGLQVGLCLNGTVSRRNKWQKQTCSRPAPVRRRSLQPSWRRAVSSSFCSRRA